MPYLFQDSFNAPLELWSGKVTIDWGWGAASTLTDLSFSWTAQAVVFLMDHPRRGEPHVSPPRLATADDGMTFKGWWHGISTHTSGSEIHGFAWDFCDAGGAGGDRALLTSVRFLVPNMLDLSTHSVVARPSVEESYNLTRVVLRNDEWRVTIDGVRATHHLQTELAKHSAWGVTHVGQIDRIDGRPFKEKSTRDLLTALSLFLSFLRGQRVACLFPFGFDRHGVVRWKNLTPRRVDRWGPVATGQPSMGKVAQNAFPGFMDLFSQKDRRDNVVLAIEGFLQAGTEQGVAASIVNAFTGLDLMAWNILVGERAALSEEGFEKLLAADRIRLLLNTLGISLEIPDDFHDLQKFTGKASFADTLTLVRNSFAHPTLKNRKKIASLSGRGRRQLWLFAMRHFELAILLWWKCPGDLLEKTSHDWDANPWSAIRDLA